MKRHETILSEKDLAEYEKVCAESLPKVSPRMQTQALILKFLQEKKEEKKRNGAK